MAALTLPRIRPVPMLARAKMHSALRGTPMSVGDSSRFVAEEEEVCRGSWDPEAKTL
jgi:hypothetical protein